MQTKVSQLKRVHLLILFKLQPLNKTLQEFGWLQEDRPNLTYLQTKAILGEAVKAHNGSIFQFVLENGLLYRKCLASGCPRKIGSLSLIIPKERRPIVLRTTHKGPMAGNFSHS